ncbi:hypothetical protein CSHISOI_10871, partial [Colletotrichum shisoi]
MTILGHTSSALPEAAELLLYCYELVNTYSTRNLSYESDRLQAISGIAEDFAAALRDECVCGLWKSDLPAGLVWATPGPRHLQVPFPYPVPGTMPRSSWSWASLNGRVTWTNSHLKKQKDADFEILGYDVELESPNAPFGEVRKGELHIRGLPMSVTPPSVGHRGDLVVSSGHREMPVQLDYLNDPRTSTGSRFPLSVLVVVNTGRSIIEGLLVQSLDSINMLIDTYYEIGAFVLYIFAWAIVAVIAVLSFLGFAAGVFTFMLHQSIFVDGEDREARWDRQRTSEASARDSSGASTGSDMTPYETFSDEPKHDTD